MCYLIETKTPVKMKQKKSLFGIVGAGMLAALSMLPGMRPAGNMPITQASQRSVQSNSRQKSTPIQAPVKNTVVQQIGGLPLATRVANYGMSPKEYGMLYGNGGSKRSNRLRLGHNAKLKRRMA